MLRFSVTRSVRLDRAIGTSTVACRSKKRREYASSEAGAISAKTLALCLKRESRTVTGRWESSRRRRRRRGKKKKKRKEKRKRNPSSTSKTLTRRREGKRNLLALMDVDMEKVSFVFSRFCVSSSRTHFHLSLAARLNVISACLINILLHTIRVRRDSPEIAC